jgi:hypothetical protein
MAAEDDSLFEAMYRAWIARFGGIDQPALREDLEREERSGGKQKYVPKRCPHNKTANTCSVCYFEDWE